MITVVPIQQKELQKELCARCNVTYDPDLLAYYAKDTEGRFAGICQFKMDENGGHLLSLAAPEGTDMPDPLFVMGRTALNFIDLCGVKTAYFEGENVDEALLLRIGFAKDENGRYGINLDGFFTGGCKCH